jgi:hypothetical protein
MKETLKSHTKWIWIFNCTDLTSQQACDIQLALGIANLVQTTPGFRGVYVQNTNWAVKKLIGILQVALPVAAYLHIDETPPTFSPLV